jgi:hypothetical protein
MSARPPVWRQGSARGDVLLLTQPRRRSSREHLAGYAGIMQADAFPGFNGLYDARRKPAPIIEAACWSHGRRHFFDLATLSKSPIAVEAVRRIDELFEIERTINGKMPAERVAVRQEQTKPLVDDLKVWMRQQRDRLAPSHDPQPLGRLHPLPRRRPNLLIKQCCGARSPLRCRGQEKLDLRRFGRRRASRCCCLHPD